MPSSPNDLPIILCFPLKTCQRRKVHFSVYTLTSWFTYYLGAWALDPVSALAKFSFWASKAEIQTLELGGSTSSSAHARLHSEAGSQHLLWPIGWWSLQTKKSLLLYVFMYLLCFLRFIIGAYFFLTFISVFLFYLFHFLTSSLSLLNPKFIAFIFLIFFRKPLLWFLLLKPLEFSLHSFGRCCWLSYSFMLTGPAVQASSCFDVNWTVCINMF